MSDPIFLSFTQRGCNVCRQVTWHDPEGEGTDCWGIATDVPDMTPFMASVTAMQPDDLLLEWPGRHAERARPMNPVLSVFRAATAMQGATWEQIQRHYGNSAWNIMRKTLHVIQEAVHLEVTT